MTTSDDSINNPHDKFTRRVLGDIDNVRALIAWQIPKQVLAVLRLDTIRPASQSFVDGLLRVGLSDLVFEIQLAPGNDAYVVFLVEHKSSPDPMTPFQVLRYIVQINEQRLRSGEPLCCVIPLVLYHGTHSWNTFRTMRELVGAPAELAGYVPEFALPLVDLSVCTDDELRQESLFLAYMSLLKYILREELRERLPEILGAFHRILPPATAYENLATILRYLVTATDRVSREELTVVVSNVLQSEGESIMPTIAEQWRQEGIEKGKLIGRIRLLEEILGHSPSSEDTLARESLEVLQKQCEALQLELRQGRDE